ncbi:MAG: hydroxysqualene dehydroxylase HpnE [Rubrivivax sp.]
MDRDAHALARALSTPAPAGASAHPPRVAGAGGPGGSAGGLRVAVVGAGWAGLAAAVHARAAGHAVRVFEMAPQPGGRARSVAVDGLELDNGQHILIGAYTATLALMRRVGADPDALLLRLPLLLRMPDGRGLALRPGAPIPAFARAVLAADGWTVGERLRLLAAASGWALRGFRCAPALDVASLCRRMPAAVRRELIEPLCVAALNTPAAEASAQVFLRVLHDALFSGPGASDLLLPRHGLDALLPRPAARWLEAHGAELLPRRRVMRVEPAGGGWMVDGERHDRVVLACSAAESARLAEHIAPQWAQTAAALRYEPIVTVYLHSAAGGLVHPITALPAGADAPAQFAFDLGALAGRMGISAWVVSGAAEWLAQGLPVLAEQVRRQAAAVLGTAPALPATVHLAAERRATFRCTPQLRRPPMALARGLLAAGDYVAGPYPATLEGAVQSGRDAAAALAAG